MSLLNLPLWGLSGLAEAPGVGGEGGGNGLGTGTRLLAPRRRSRTNGLRVGRQGPHSGGSQDQRSRPGKRRSRFVSGVLLLVLAPFALFGLMLMAFAASSEPELPEGVAGPSAEALADIPGDFLVLYQEAGAAEGIDWAILAGIGKLECDHGRSSLAGCDPPGTINQAGARGPMQFLGSTWRGSAGQFALEVAGAPVPDGQESLGFATDGDGDGVADPWSTADAIYAAARYLGHHGAPEDYDGAVFAYNRSQVYVSEVFEWADTYRDAAESAAASATGVAVDPGGAVELATVGGITVHVAIAEPLESMLAAAAADGVSLTGSGYRDPQQQIDLRKQHCGTSDYAIYEMPSSQCSPPTARPGHSMHERGLAIDFENCSSQSTACFSWLRANASTYGFYNLPSEPWHWSTDGT